MSSYDHYFLSDGGKVVSHKPTNLLIHVAPAGDAHSNGTGKGSIHAKRTFSIAIKTSEDKLKRRLNKTAPIRECFICADTDPAYLERRAKLEAATAAAALLGGQTSDGEDAPAPPTPQASSGRSRTAAQTAALQNYIGSKELFVTPPGDGIVCLRLRAAEDASLAPNGGHSGGRKGDGAGSGGDGFMYSVETKGGKSAGRQKQRYVLLQRGCIYALLLPAELVVTKIETRDKHGEITPVKHWISTHAQLQRHTAQSLSQMAAGLPQGFVPPTTAANGFTMPASAPFATPQHMFAPPMQTPLMPFFSPSVPLPLSNTSPFSSAGPSPAGRNTFLPPNLGVNGISPVNGMASYMNFSRSPQQAAQQLVMQHQQQQQQAAGMFAASALAGLSSFPSPTSQLMHNLNQMLPQLPSNNVSPSSMLAMALGGGGSMSNLINAQTAAMLSLSNPGSTRSNNGGGAPMSGVSSAIMSPSIGSPAGGGGGLLSAPLSTDASPLAGAGGLGTTTKVEPTSPTSAQAQIQQLQSLLNQSNQLVRQQQQQLQLQQTVAGMPFSQSPFTFVPNGNFSAGIGSSDMVASTASAATNAATAAPLARSVSRSKFNFSVPAPSSSAGATTTTEAASSAQSIVPPVASHHHGQLMDSSSSAANTHSAAAPSLSAPFFNAHPPAAVKDELQHSSPLFARSTSHGHGDHSDPNGGMSMLQDSPNDNGDGAALHSAYWNPSNPVAPSSSSGHAAGPVLEELPSVNSPDFLCADFSGDAHGMHNSAAMDVPASFFASSPLLQNDSSDRDPCSSGVASSNVSHASNSKEHSPAADPLRLQSLHTHQQQQLSSSLSRSNSDSLLPPASLLAAALRTPVLPLDSHSSLLLEHELSGSSSSAHSGSRRLKRKKVASSSKRHRGDSSASSSVVSESIRVGGGARAGYTLSPRQWRLALKKPPFRATLSVTRSNHGERFKSSDLILIKFGGSFLDSSKIDIYKRQLIIELPPPPSTVAIMQSAGLPGVEDALPRSNIEVDLELHVNGVLKFMSTFSYKLGSAQKFTGEDTTSSSSSGSDDDDDDARGDRSSEGGDSFGGGSGKDGSSGSSSEAPGSPDRDQPDGESKRHKPDGGNGAGGDGNNGGGGNGHSYATQQYSLHGEVQPAVRLTADLDAIPLFSRGVLKTFPLLSLGLQDVLQTFLLQACVRERGDTDADVKAAAVQDRMIAEEMGDGVCAGNSDSSSCVTPPSTARVLAPGTISKRHTTGSRAFEQLQASGVLKPRSNSSDNELGRSGSSHTVPNTPASRSPFKPKASARRQSVSASSRAAARILFVQAVTSQQPMHFVSTALTAAVQAAVHRTGVEHMFAHGDVHSVDSFGFSLLHYAVGVGLPALVETLLAAGADPNLQARAQQASHAITPAQLLQLRMVTEQQRAARRAARAARALSPRGASGSAHSSPRRSHSHKQRRISGGADDAGSTRSGPSRSASRASNSEVGEAFEDSSMSEIVSPALPPRQPLVLGFSSLHSLAPTPAGPSAHSSTSTSVANTPTSVAFKSRTSIAGKDILQASQQASKSFHFGLLPDARERNASGGSAEKLLQASAFQMQQQQQLHVYHAHHVPSMMPHLDKASLAMHGSTATTAAPTPSSHLGSVLSSPVVNAWHAYPSPLASIHSPLMSAVGVSVAPLPTSSAASAAVTPATPDAQQTNRLMASIFHAHSVSPQGLALSAAQAQAHSVRAAQAQEPVVVPAAIQAAMHFNQQLHAYVHQRWQAARAQKQAQLAAAQQQQQQQLSSASSERLSPSLEQTDAGREQQRELVMLELALLLLHAQKHSGALKLPLILTLPAEEPDASTTGTLSSPMQSLHIHALRSLLSQFHLLRKYYLAYKRYQAEQAQLSNLVANIQLDDDAAEPVDEEVSSMASEQVSGQNAQADESSTPLSDESILAFFSHVPLIEHVLREQVICMQRTLASFMQRALLQSKMQREKFKALAAVRARSITEVRSTKPGSRSLNTVSNSPPSSVDRPLSKGHLSRTNSGILSLNIHGSIHPDQPDADESLIRVREIHGVDVLNRGGENGQQGMRIDLIVHPSAEKEESAAEFARDSARRKHGRVPTGDLLAVASSHLQTQSNLEPPSMRALAPSVAPHSSPCPSVASTPANRERGGESQAFHFSAHSAPGAASAGSKFALLLAVNDYSPTLNVSPLLGCQNDIERVGGLISSKLGFAPPRRSEASEELQFGSAMHPTAPKSWMLLHARATRAAVRHAIDSLLEAATSPADSVLLYFSGHGHTSGIMLYDGLLTFAELTYMLRDIPTKDVTFISDTCATDSVPQAAAAAAAAPASTSLNTTLSLDQMRQLVVSSEAAVQQHAVAEILAGISPAQPAPRRVVNAAAAASAMQDDSVDADAEVSASESEMDTQESSAAVPHRKQRHIQYRGLAFNQIEPREPSSELPALPARIRRRSCSDDVDTEPKSSDVCVPDDGDDEDSHTMFPVIERLLTHRGVGYFARGLLSRTDARASEVRDRHGNWHGSYTSRLCKKLEKLSGGESVHAATRRAEPVNPSIVTLQSILFHDEEAGNLSGRDSNSSTSTRSNSICGAIMPSTHQADEIDPSSVELELSALLAASSIAHDAQVEDDGVADASESPAVGAVDSSCSDASPADFNSSPPQAAGGVSRWMSLLLTLFTLLLNWQAPTSSHSGEHASDSVDEVEAAAAEDASAAALVSDDACSPSSVSATPSPAASPSSSPTPDYRHARADVVTTEAPFDSNGEQSQGGGARGNSSDSDAGADDSHAHAEDSERAKRSHLAVASTRFARSW